MDGSRTALCDGDEPGEEEGGRRGRRTNGRQAGLSRKLWRHNFWRGGVTNCHGIRHTFTDRLDTGLERKEHEVDRYPPHTHRTDTSGDCPARTPGLYPAKKRGGEGNRQIVCHKNPWEATATLLSTARVS